MKIFAAAIALAAAALPLSARAEGGDGSRQAAGGGFMSSYVSDPYHDPRSLHAQRRGTGQILGAPMLHDAPIAGPALAAGRLAGPRWAVGPAPRARR